MKPLDLKVSPEPNTPPCADCGQTPPETSMAMVTYGNTSNFICYACCAIRDRASMIATGKATLYLVEKREGVYNRAVTNWPGTLSFTVCASKTSRHNFASRRYDVWFSGPDGKTWHGYTIGDNTQLCHCRRTQAA